MIVDEVGDLYVFEVVVSVDGQECYRGSTVEIDHKVEDAFAWLRVISAVQPGTVVGMGTIPDCTGLDHDDFVDPGAAIEIRFDRLGSLRCRFAEPARRLLPSRWPLREAMKKFHGS